MAPARGLFVTGTNTDVGKTYVTAMIGRALVKRGIRVSAYKPVASGCEVVADQLVATDAVELWKATNKFAPLEAVCPQLFKEPLAPHRAAQREDKTVDEELLRSGLEAATRDSEFVLIEGAGGLLSPISDEEYNADLALDFGYPMVVVAANELGVINQTLQTLVTAETFRAGIPTVGVILNDRHGAGDLSCRSNAADLRERSLVPLLAEVGHHASSLEDVDWYELGKP